MKPRVKRNNIKSKMAYNDGGQVTKKDTYEIGDKIKFMDRVYTTHEYMVNIAKKWAKENGYFYKSNQTYGHLEEVCTPNGEEVKLKMSLDIKSKNYKHYPYMDTFPYGYKKKITNYQIKDQRYISIRELRDQD
jgi:SLT domain-containing protein